MTRIATGADYPSGRTGPPRRALVPAHRERVVPPLWCRVDRPRILPGMPRSSSGRTRPEPSNVVEAKVRVPSPPPWAVSRAPLVNRLRTASASLVTLTAPAGYGKTTLAAQWAERERRPVAWLSVDEADDDAAHLLAQIAAALDRLERQAGTRRTPAEGVDGRARATRHPAALERGLRAGGRRCSSPPLPQRDEGIGDPGRADPGRVSAGAGRPTHAHLADRAAAGGREAAGAAGRRAGTEPSRGRGAPSRARRRARGRRRRRSARAV